MTALMSSSPTIEGSKQVINLTAGAVAQVRAMWQDAPDDAGKPLRVYVEQGGCSGMQYGLVFDEVRDGDAMHEFDGVPVVVDPASAEFLAGSVVDFSDSLNGGGFKVSNPKARQNCGCGKSFEA